MSKPVVKTSWGRPPALSSLHKALGLSCRSLFSLKVLPPRCEPPPYRWSFSRWGSSTSFLSIFQGSFAIFLMLDIFCRLSSPPIHPQVSFQLHCDLLSCKGTLKAPFFCEREELYRSWWYRLCYQEGHLLSSKLFVVGYPFQHKSCPFHPYL